MDCKVRRDWAERASKVSKISPELYQKYDVKRGLRNADGTGVKVGITNICEVIGYEMVDGVKVPVPGQLKYRGYDLKEMVESYERENRFGFEEIVFLLLFGDLPKRDELALFSDLLDCHRSLPDHFNEDIILNTPSQNIMNKLQRTILTLFSYDENADDNSLENVLLQCIDLIAKLPTLMSYSYRAKKHYYDHDSLIIHHPKMGASTAENILHLCRDNRKYSEEEARILDLLLIVQAEHGGGNNSTFTTRVVSSAGTDTYSAFAAAIGSLKGMKHGGANERVSAMVTDIMKNVKDWTDGDEVKAYLKKIRAGEAFDGTGLIYGMGHAVYTLSDPRAELLKDRAQKLAAKRGFESHFKLLNLIEEKTKEIFREEKGEDFTICANVDLYSGMVFHMLGIPRDLYTPIFAAARIAGWSAHRMETISDGKIIRPAFITLAEKRGYQSLGERSNSGRS